MNIKALLMTIIASNLFAADIARISEYTPCHLEKQQKFLLGTLGYEAAADQNLNVAVIRISAGFFRTSTRLDPESDSVKEAICLLKKLVESKEDVLRETHKEIDSFVEKVINTPFGSYKGFGNQISMFFKTLPAWPQ